MTHVTDELIEIQDKAIRRQNYGDTVNKLNISTHVFLDIDDGWIDAVSILVNLGRILVPLTHLKMSMKKLNICDHDIPDKHSLAMSSRNFSFIDPYRYSEKMNSTEDYLKAARIIHLSDVSNYQQARILVSLDLNIEAWKRHLQE